MNTFTLHLESSTQYERIEHVVSFVGEDDSGSFGILAGGGVDFRVSTTLALRLQGDYLASDNGAEGIASCPPTPSGVSCEASGGGWSSGYRVSAGIVYRFGSAR